MPKLKPYLIDVVVWRPTIYRYVLNAPNEISARQEALRDSRTAIPAGTAKETNIPVRTTLLRSERI